VLQQAIDDAEHQLARLSGGTFVETPTGATTTVDETLLIGSPRRVGTVRSRTRTFEETNLELPNLEALESAWREEIRPYLSSFTLKLPRLEMPLRATEYFAELKRRVGPAAHELVDFLEQSCQQRRQFGRQKMLHFWLHGWLAIHLPLSIALMIFLVVHVITALRYSVDLW
jgi:hypothetical protein